MMTRRHLLERTTAALIGATAVGSLAGRDTAQPPRRFARGGVVAGNTTAIEMTAGEYVVPAGQLVTLRKGDSLTCRWRFHLDAASGAYSVEDIGPTTIRRAA